MMQKPKWSVFVGLLAPGILIYSFIVIFPLAVSVRYSLFDWSGGPVMKYIGLKNFINLASDKIFWSSARNNILLVLMCFVGQIGIALIISVLLSSRILKWKEFHRTVIFMPVILATVVVGLIWYMVYNYDYGLLNTILRILGLGSITHAWLGDPKSVMIFVSFAIIWQYIGLYLVIFMAAISSIPKEILEVAEIDGATAFRKTVSITIPLIMDTFKVSVMLCIAGNMRIFDHIFVLTMGGPGNSSMVMAQYAYINSFIMFYLGYGSSISIGILVLSLVLIFISRRILSRGVENEG
jgi:raffinose/stachyose/melibiose transport system permease protein